MKLGMMPTPQQPAAHLAPVLAQAIDARRAELQGGLTQILRLQIEQYLQLAADLPNNAELAISLEHLISDLEKALPGFWLQDDLAPLAARTLYLQQIDARAEGLWYRLLASADQTPWTPQQRTILLYAWLGLLYIPLDPDASREGLSVNTDRLARGLLILETSVRSHEGGPQLIRLALQNLDQKLPRPPQFWVKCFGPRLDNWPQLLREAVIQQWPMFSRDQVFISYSHRDIKFMEELCTHLKPYLRSGAVTPWSDQQITPGSKWLGEIQATLEKTCIAVLLVSPDFLASDFVHNHELGPLLKEAETGGVKILWLLLRACAFEETPLKDYQAVVSPLEKPLAQRRNRDETWVRVCKEIRSQHPRYVGTNYSSPQLSVI